MKKEFKKEDIVARRGFYTPWHLESLSFMQKDSISLMDIMESEIPQIDKSRFLFKECELTRLQKDELALTLAEAAISIFEKKYPENKSPRKAIDAAKNYSKGLIDYDTLTKIRGEVTDAVHIFDVDEDTYNAAYIAIGAVVGFGDNDVYDAVYAPGYKSKLDNLLIKFIENN